MLVVEERLMDLDRKLPELVPDPARRSTLSVGSLLNYVTDDVKTLGLNDVDLLRLVKQRVMDKEVVGGIHTRYTVSLSLFIGG